MNIQIKVTVNFQHFSVSEVHLKIGHLKTRMKC